jgi:hypothetical protein
MGGNFVSATPDTLVTGAALQKCKLTVHVSTKLNRSHLITGKTALILPCLVRQKLLKPLLDRAQHKLSGLPTGQSRWLALTLFIGVPAPGTGGWTGVVIAYLLNMSFAEAMSSVTCGVMLAGLIMTILTLAGKVGALIALAALVVAGVGAIASAKKD